MKRIYSTHHPSPLLVEARQREVLRHSAKFFKLFRERREEKGPSTSRQPSRFLSCLNDTNLILPICKDNTVATSEEVKTQRYNFLTIRGNLK